MTWQVLSSVDTSADRRDWILTLINFLVNAVVFLLNSLVSLLSSIGRLFVRIFTGEFFDFLMDIFDYLSVYLWTAWATTLMWLFWLVFFILVFGLVFRLLKWRVNYDATLKKYHKNHPSK